MATDILDFAFSSYLGSCVQILAEAHRLHLSSGPWPEASSTFSPSHPALASPASLVSLSCLPAARLTFKIETGLRFFLALKPFHGSPLPAEGHSDFAVWPTEPSRICPRPPQSQPGFP